MPRLPFGLIGAYHIRIDHGQSIVSRERDRRVGRGNDKTRGRFDLWVIERLKAVAFGLQKGLTIYRKVLSRLDLAHSSVRKRQKRRRRELLQQTGYDARVVEMRLDTLDG